MICPTQLDRRYSTTVSVDRTIFFRETHYAQKTGEMKLVELLFLR